MKLTRLAGALATTALLISGCSLTTHHTAAAPAPRAARTAAVHLAPARALAADPALRWLTSPGGQAQVTLNQDVDTLAGALVIGASRTRPPPSPTT